MAWTVIIEVGKALRALTMRNLRDNISAVANGDAGAPKVQTAGIQDLAVTTAKIAAGNVTTTKIATGAVAAWNASLGTGEIGTYALLCNRTSGRPCVPGGNYAGSLDYASVNNGTNGAAGGTWKCMGDAPSLNISTVFLRIS